MSSFDLKALQMAVDDHGAVARIVIATRDGSAPRGAGTSMLVWDTGQSGTIGGGALEFQAVGMAQKRLAGSKHPQIAKMPLGPALGQCCGGAVTLVIECFTAATLKEIDGTQAAYARRVDRETSKNPPLPVQRNLETANSFDYGNGWLTEPLAESKRQLWLWGAGHVGRAIVETLRDLPFDITWIDVDPSRFPDVIPDHATQLFAVNPGDLVKHAPRNAEHLVLTYSHALDQELCHRILNQPFNSLGLIGSATKHRRFEKRLADLGHNHTEIARINCPIGHPELGKHPKAIAIGIAVELMQPAEAAVAKREAIS